MEKDVDVVKKVMSFVQKSQEVDNPAGLDQDIGICAGLDGKLLDDYDEKSCVDSGKESVKKMNAPALLMANSKIQKKWFKVSRVLLKITDIRSSSEDLKRKKIIKCDQ